MKTLVLHDSNFDINIKGCLDLLNSICTSTKFDSHTDPTNTQDQDGLISEDEYKAFLPLISNLKVDRIIYLTSRQYPSNYFLETNNNIYIISFWGWKYLTSLPVENGLFYFIADIFALDVDNSFRHEETTGCIYDFLFDKTGIHQGMRMAIVCEQCLERIKVLVEKDKNASKVFNDLVGILNILSHTSKWNKNVLEVKNSVNSIIPDWLSFEDHVADIYRSIGVKVKQNVNFAGFQVDIYLEEETLSKQTIKTAVECKYYNEKNKVGNSTVNDFNRKVETLIQKGIVDRGIIVSSSGFTQDASLVAEGTKIELLKYNDLEPRKIPNNRGAVAQLKKTKSSITKFEEHFKEQKKRIPDIFVIMPFDEELEDIYFLGIVEIAERLNYSCTRVDRIEFNGLILDKIISSIKNSKIIIAEVSARNANVYYELGFAHALNKRVILITKDVSYSPLDTAHYNHLVYRNIRNLREQLEPNIKAILTQSS